MSAKSCVIDTDKTCDACGDCDICDLDPTKKCDNCCRCIGMDGDFISKPVHHIARDEEESQRLLREIASHDDGIGEKRP